MNFKHIVLISTLASSLLSAMDQLAPSSNFVPIENLETIIEFYRTKKSIFKRMRDERNSEFGKTIVVNIIQEKPFFAKTGTIQKLNAIDLEQIGNGRSFYCFDIKESGHGAIICGDKCKQDVDLRHIANNFKLFYLQQLYKKNRPQNNAGNLYSDLPPCDKTSADKVPMHITSLDTEISFFQRKLSLFKWIRDYRNELFGLTMIVKMIEEKPFFVELGTIQTVHENDLEQIGTGNACYCPDIGKVDNRSTFGAIILYGNCEDEQNDRSHYNLPRLANCFKIFYLQNIYEKEKSKQASGYSQVSFDTIMKK